MGTGAWLRRAAWFGIAAATVILAVPVLRAQAPKTDADVIREQLRGYPLKTCVVGGEELGKMGEPVNHVHKGRLVRFCCAGCLKDFRKDPAKYIAKIDAAAKAVKAGGGGHDAHGAAKADAPAHAGHDAPKAAARPPAAKRASGAKYYCPMHPSYTAAGPGECPICHMALEPIPEELGGGESAVEGHATVTIRPERQQLIGLKWGTAEKRPVARTIRAAARVDYNERSLSVVSLKFRGWVEHLAVNAVGDAVRKGEPVLEVYSPEVFEAERNYLVALASARAAGEGEGDPSKAFADDALKAARERLVLLDLTEEQVRALDPQSPPPARVPILARADGTVVRRNVTQGQAVEPGQDLLEIADLSTVWINADVFEQEVPDVKPGAEVSIHLAAFPGEAVAGRVTYVHPFLNERTRTVRVRIEVPNPEGRLKPGMLAEAAIPVELGEQVVVDDGAVLDTGRRQIVFVGGVDDRIEPRPVTVGHRFDGQAVVLKGLQGGERVVASGTFLIDSESQIKYALIQATTGDAAPGGHAH